MTIREAVLRVVLKQSHLLRHRGRFCENRFPEPGSVCGPISPPSLKDPHGRAVAVPSQPASFYVRECSSFWLEI
jgi:hypothetical protein